MRTESRDTHDLGHVQDDDGGLKTDTNTGNQTTGYNGAQRIDFRTSDHLNDNTDEVDETAENDSPFATDDISHVT